MPSEQTYSAEELALERGPQGRRPIGELRATWDRREGTVTVYHGSHGKKVSPAIARLYAAELLACAGAAERSSS